MADVVCIELTQGKSVLLDAADLPLVQPYTWYAIYDKKSDAFYAVTKLPVFEGKRRVLGMHRLLMGDPPGKRVDHANRDTLDCRRKNLRIAPVGPNRANSRLNRNSKSGYRGVYARRDIPNYYSVYISTGSSGRPKFVGAFSDPIHAAHAYDEAARLAYGEFASLNFPNESEQLKYFDGNINATISHRITRRDNSSGFRGVSKDSRVKEWDCWIAGITINGKFQRIGSFTTAEEAARAYDIVARRSLGDSAVLNFPDEQTQESIALTPKHTRGDSKSGFRGVGFEKRAKTKPWRAYLIQDGKTIGLGTFATPEEAAQKYDAAAREAFGENARLNFPGSNHQSLISPTAPAPST